MQGTDVEVAKKTWKKFRYRAKAMHACYVIAPFIGKVALVQKPFNPTQLPFCVGGRNLGKEIPWDK